jgi:hypothetical protein
MKHVTSLPAQNMAYIRCSTGTTPYQKEKEIRKSDSPYVEQKNL